MSRVTDRKGQITSFTYDPLNRLTQAADSLSGNITFGYDNLDHLTSETSSRGTVSYTYDEAGRLTSMTVAGQPVVTYTYDNADRLRGITQGATSVGFAYDNADRRTSLSLPNGVVVEAGYDEAAQLTSLTYKQGATTLGNLTYGYDGAGRHTQMGGSFARVLMPQPVASATYDAANQLTQRGASTLAYDANGNLTSDGANTYVWNARNQLASIGGAGLTLNFQYDALGRRIGKTVNGQTTGYVYAGANAVQELSGTTPVANILTGGVDKIFSRSDVSDTKTPLTDALDSTLALTDSTGAITSEYTYDPFGNTTQTGMASNHPNQYTSRENDGTGLYYYRNRYYSPTLQRFITEDPIGFAGGDANLYAYVGNDPINFQDPSGLERNNPDVKKIYDNYRKAMYQMIDSGQRGPASGWAGGIWINFASAVGIKPNYLACADQAQRVTEKLQNSPTPYRDSWTFQTQTYSVPWHTWGIAKSNNPANPDIVYDSWKDTIECKCKK